MSDSYCDGLGKCLPACPVDAIKLEEKDVDEFDQARKGFALKEGEESKGCGSTKEMTFNVTSEPSAPAKPASPFAVKTESPFAPAPKMEEGCSCGGGTEDLFKSADKPAGFKPNAPLQVDTNGINPSQLRQWPVQINLVSTNASFFEDSNILIAADCAAYAYANFHQEFIKGRVTLIGCPKLDDLNGYIEKLAMIFKSHNINSVTVARMSVPCCGGIVTGVKKALELSGKAIPYLERTITPDGQLK
jgi:ferredoxin